MPLKGAYSEAELVQRIARAEIEVDRLRAENERLKAVDRIAKALFIRDHGDRWEYATQVTRNAYRDEARCLQEATNEDRHQQRPR